MWLGTDFLQPYSRPNLPLHPLARWQVWAVGAQVNGIFMLWFIGEPARWWGAGRF